MAVAASMQIIGHLEINLPEILPRSAPIARELQTIRRSSG
jgi:hypothetical protein